MEPMELPEWLAAEVAAGKVTKKESRFRGSQGATTRVYSQMSVALHMRVDAT